MANEQGQGKTGSFRDSYYLILPGYHIHIKGRVQGVGFRPFVYRLAQEMNVAGWVSNTSDGVHIEIDAKPALAQAFYRRCIEHPPVQSLVTDHDIEEIVQQSFSGFEIRQSTENGRPDLTITPDFAICGDCMQELSDTADRRFSYPFITCTNCGPRYSILDGLPYDRHLTSMEAFGMCERCRAEYEDPTDRRYYSQTNSCSQCGISLLLTSADGHEVTNQEQALKSVNSALNEGRILAVKGIGGYLLMCDATRPSSVRLLRERKHRPEKPFAVLYPDSALLKKDVYVTDHQARLLNGPVAPILILPLKPELPSGLCHELVAPRLWHLGVMLPYAPILYLIARQFRKPLIATSANLSGSPIVYRNDRAHHELFRFADLILSHDREICMPQDDSVIKPTPFNKETIIIRRSRGLAPGYEHSMDLPEQTVLSLGAEMKGSFGLSTGNNMYVSQFLGDLEGFESQETFRQALSHFLRLTKAEPQAVLTDLHPGYFTTSLGEQLANEMQIPVHQVQHHEAHFAAVLAENNVAETSEEVLGVIWDGMGYGHDGNIWGGEFFTFRNGEMERTAHIEYFPWMAGNKMAREPRLSAFSLTHGHPVLKGTFNNNEWEFYRKLIVHPDLYTSSVGRLFDAVAALLGELERSTYEGQAGLLLEQRALEYFEHSNWKKPEPYGFEISGSVVSIRPMLSEIIDDLAKYTEHSEIVARFHQTLVMIIEKTAEQGGYGHLAFSGGVFQNGVLTDLIRQQLGEAYQLCFHRQMPPNDENIAFGQLIHYINGSTRPSLKMEEHYIKS